MMTERTAFKSLLTVSCLLLVVLLAVSFSSGAQESPPAESEQEEEAVVDFAELKSPVPYTQKSIDRGAVLFRRYCTECHGADGRALMDVIADATDLTSPKMWLSGTAEGEVFRSIRDGAGVSMPPFSFQISRETEMWHMVNFVQSLWPESKRPELVVEQDENDDADEESSESGGDDRGE